MLNKTHNVTFDRNWLFIHGEILEVLFWIAILLHSLHLFTRLSYNLAYPSITGIYYIE